MKSHVDPLVFISAVVAYANVFGVSINSIVLPDDLKYPVPATKLKSTLEAVQLQWLQQTTGRIWDGGEFFQLYSQIECWIQDNLHFCPEGDNYILWQGQMWKRGAEYLLSLRAKEM